MFMYYYAVCYFTCIFYAVVRQISMLFIDNKDSVVCILTCQRKLAVKEWFRVPSARTDWLIGSVSQRLATP